MCVCQLRAEYNKQKGTEEELKPHVTRGGTAGRQRTESVIELEF